MYYEEREIDGVLCWRNNPNSEFTPYTAKELTSTVQYYQDELRTLKRYLDDFFYCL